MTEREMKRDLVAAGVVIVVFFVTSAIAFYLHGRLVERTAERDGWKRTSQYWRERAEQAEPIADAYTRIDDLPRTNALEKEFYYANNSRRD
jgi:uncharacterized membrane protein